MNELLHFWLAPAPKEVGRSWFPPSRLTTIFASLYTDASKFAWGAHFHHAYCHNWAQGPDSELSSLPPGTNVLAQGPSLARSTFTLDQQATGSTAREFDAVIEALKLFAPKAIGACIRLFSDNTGVVQILKKGFSPNAALRNKYVILQTILQDNCCSIDAHHISGERNTVADALSRTNLGDNYKLCPAIFDAIQHFG